VQTEVTYVAPFSCFRRKARTNVVVQHQLVGAVAAGNADHVELRAIGEGDGRRQRDHGIARHGLDAFPDQMNRHVGQAGEDLGGTGEIELGDTRKNQKTDLQRARHVQPRQRA